MTDHIHTYDAVILGAGINGCGIARELTRRGRCVAVVDKDEIGSGTSSKSSRLIHGGLRYLERLHLRLVREALHDRAELAAAYPDLVTLQPFYFPVYDDSPRPPWIIWTGLKMYDLLAGHLDGGRARRVPATLFGREFPAIRRDRLQTVFRYCDGKTHDRELTRRVAREACQQGCRVLENTPVKKVVWDSDAFRIDTGAGVLQSRCLVNATGPWIDEVVERFSLPANFTIRKVSGIHIFFSGLLTPSPLFLQAGDRRIFFVIPEPEKDRTMVGTTEREESLPVDQVEVAQEDVRYLIDRLNRYLIQERQMHLQDVRDACVGIRPLVENRTGSTDLSREYRLDLHRRGQTRLLHVFGGKLTTFPSLARRAAQALGVR